MNNASAIQPVRDDADYEAALAEVRELWGSKPGTADGDRLDVLMVFLEEYEAETHAVGLPHPIEAIKTRMEDLGLDREDLSGLLGIGSGRVSEILNRRRRLTLDMIRILAKGLKLSEACLVQFYELVPPDATARRAPESRPPDAGAHGGRRRKEVA